MSRIVICAPRISEGARDLRDHINNNSNVDATYRRRDNLSRLRMQLSPSNSLIVNWGCGGNNFRSTQDFNIQAGNNVPRLNRNTNTATNKLEAFRAMCGAGINVPEYTSSLNIARRWVAMGHRVYCRTNLRGHSGEDIVMADQDNLPIQAPLYTREVVKRHEFRFHVVGGQVIDGVRKAFRADVAREDRDRTIMNHAAGSVFIRSGRSLTEAHQDQELHQMCVRAVGAVGLDFGAVDVMSDSDGNYYVLEVNTAPGLEATTLERYSNALQAIVNNEQVQSWFTIPLNPNQAIAELTQTETQTQETNTMSLLTQALLNSATNRTLLAAGLSVVVNDAFSGGTLTIGNRYTIHDVVQGSSNNTVWMIQLRNNNGSLQRYTVRDQFNISAESLAQLQPVGAAAPQLPPVNESRSLLATSPERCTELSDGTMVNVGGRVTYSGSGSSLLTTGNSYQVADIRYGENSGDCFIGLAVGNDNSIRRWLKSNFTAGQRVSTDGSNAAAPAAAPEISPVTDQAGINLTVGDRVRITTRNGGHGLTVGSFQVIQSINTQNNNITVRGHNRPIAGRRVVKVTQQEEQAQAELQTQANQTQRITIGDRQYIIRARDLQRAQQFLSSISV